MLLNLNSRRSGIQTDVCPFIKVRRSTCPLLPWPSIWIHSEMSDRGRVICAPPPSQKLGGARVPSFRRSSLACYKFRDVWQAGSPVSHLCPPPPLPSQTMGGARAPLPIPAFNPFRDVSQAGPPVPPSQKLGGARVLSFRRSSLVEMPDTSRFAHFTPLINWLINASREGSRRPGALGGVKGAPVRVYR